jgi:DNA-binding NarL/FixJ family response regulator
MERMSATDSVIRVLVVDDHALLRDGVAALVNAERDMKLVAQAANGNDAVETFRRILPDITLMDLQMPGLKGVDAIIAIRRNFPDARIIVLTTYSGDALAVRALRAGARAYLLKGNVRRELLDTIRAVHRGEQRIQSEVAAMVAAHCAEDELTPREVDVLQVIASGRSNKEAAFQLSITEETVKSHVGNILQKLRASDRTHAVTIALQRGIIEI